MFQPLLINTVLDWERRLEIEDERRAAGRREPINNHLAPLSGRGRWLLARWKSARPAPQPQPQARTAVRPLECCPEVQPG